MSSMDSFFITDKAAEGVKLPLLLDGDEGDHYVIVRGKDCEAYRQATAESVIRSRDVLLSDATVAERAKSLVDERFLVLASLIVDWSFDEPVDTENAFKFVSSIPETIAAKIEKLADDRGEYLKKP